MIDVSLYLGLLLAPVAMLSLTLVRLYLVFSGDNDRIADQDAVVVKSVERIALSHGAPAVSIVLDLEDVVAGEGSVAPIRRLLGQRYRNLEVVVLARHVGVPSDLSLAYDLIETASRDGLTTYQSRRDDRLVLVLVSADRATTPNGRLLAGVEAASGDLLLPAQPHWGLRPLAVAELASTWIRSPRAAVSIGTVEPVASKRSLSRKAAARADVMALAGTLTGVVAHAALSTLASSGDGAIVGLFRRDILLRMGGPDGSLARASTWSCVGDWLRLDAERNRTRNSVEITALPLGRVRADASAGPTRVSVRRPESWALTTWASREPMVIAQQMALLTAVSIVAAATGYVSGRIGTNVLWVCASVPLLGASAIVLSLIIDDRSVRPEGRTVGRIQMLAGALVASLGGVAGSPLRWSTKNL